MSRTCDNCKKTIPLSNNLIEVRFIGVKEMEALFGTSQLDFCSLKCLIVFWSENPKELNK